MNDRFRFKVFYKPHNKIYNVICLNSDRQKEIIIEYKDSTALVEWKNCDILQCTGKKDKNGILIYEGDIVRFKDCNDILVIKYQKEMACFAPQFYCNGKYGGRLWFDDYDSSECQFYKSSNFEVIGNIYENKELLDERD